VLAGTDPRPAAGTDGHRRRRPGPLRRALCRGDRRLLALFDSRWLLLAGWVHYLCFDLLVGTWEVEDARARGIPHLVVVPCLVLTFLFGPAGWLLYKGVASVQFRSKA
jgi:hypothetical protein